MTHIEGYTEWDIIFHVQQQSLTMDYWYQQVPVFQQYLGNYVVYKNVLQQLKGFLFSCYACFCCIKIRTEMAEKSQVRY